MIIVAEEIIPLFIGRDETKSLGIEAVNYPLNQPWMIGNRNGASSRMTICKEFRSTVKKPAAIPLYPPQIPQKHELVLNPTRCSENSVTNSLIYETALDLI
jgi:hypothetical protein